MPDNSSTNSFEVEDPDARARKIHNYLMRCSRISILSIGVALLILLIYIVCSTAWGIDGSALRAALDWNFVAILGIAIFCFALPVIKTIALSKDGATLSIQEELNVIDKRVTENTLHLAKQLEGVIKNLNKLNPDEMKPGSLQPAAAVGVALRNSESFSGGKAPLGEILTLEDAIKLLPPPTHENDPQKDRFGGKEFNENRRLSADLAPSSMGPKWRKVSFTLESTDGKPLTGSKAFFFLHDSFSPEMRAIDVPEGALKVTLKPRQSYGGFTAGVLADNGRTKLEIDLQTTPNIEAPRW